MVKLKRPPTYNDDGTITIYLTKGLCAVIDSVDADLAKINWRAGGKNNHFQYATRTIRPNGREMLHNLILERAINRRLESDELVDHKDTDTLNNRRSNLRPATVNQNSQNRRKKQNTSSPYKGVTWNKQASKWQAGIKHNRKSYNLGLFTDPLEAHKRYVEKATELFGEFARAG